MYEVEKNLLKFFTPNRGGEPNPSGEGFGLKKFIFSLYIYIV